MKTNDSQTMHATQFRAQAAQLHVTLTRKTVVRISQQHQGFPIINYNQCNQNFCTVLVIEVLEMLEKFTMSCQ